MEEAWVLDLKEQKQPPCCRWSWIFGRVRAVFPTQRAETKEVRARARGEVFFEKLPDGSRPNRSS